MDLPGNPDVVLPAARVSVFIDGDFWHGRDWPQRRRRLQTGANPEYWIRKIEYNMARDAAVTRELERSGWLVVRFWDSDVRRRLEDVVGVLRDLSRIRAAPSR